MSRRSFIKQLATLALGASLPALARAQDGAFVPYARRETVQVFIDAVAARNDLSRRWIERAFAQGQYLPAVERLMQPPIPFGQRNWREYRARYVDERRIREGVAFRQLHRTALARAADRYGVPPEIVTAILGVETQYGRLTGGFRTLDVLLTLSFDYLRRAAYFREELEQFMLLAREQRLDPLAVRGSFAGAIGIPQFMPSSVRKWAVDFDGDRRIDLMRSAADSIGSVANFLAVHGWRRDEPILLTATPDEETDEDALAVLTEEFGGGVIADTPWSALAGRGITVDTALPLDLPVLLVDLPYVDADGTTRREYRLGTASFSAILHYNRSYFYATSVVELAQALRERAAG